jgi:hypothetical protein
MIKILLFIGCVELSWSGLVAPTWSDGPPNSDARLQMMLERSDLVIVATPQADCDGCMSEGPIEDGVTPNYNTFLPHLKIDQVLKGDVPKDKLLWISFTMMHVWPKGQTVDVSKRVFSFKVDPASRADDGFSWSPRKGKSYVFFLENRKMREPNSYEAAGKEEIIYRNFDYWFGMIPANSATISQLKELAKGT